MYKLTLAFLITFTCANFAAAQTCTLGPGDEFCTECAALIGPTGIIGGEITLNNPPGFFVSGTVAIPAACGSTALSLGDVDFNIRRGMTLSLDGDIGINPGSDITFSTFGFGFDAGTVVEVGEETFGFGFIGGFFNIPAEDLADVANNCSAAPCGTISNAVTSFPVVLIAWEAKLQPNNSVLLNWSAANEYDNDFYSIEHSTDGRIFEEMTRVDGSVLSESLTEYEYVHRKVGSGAHYYRLAQQDLDGTRTQFGVISVNVTAEVGSVYPNPVLAGQTLQFTTGKSSATRARIFDLTGREVANFPLVADGVTQTIVPATLPSGTYILRYADVSKRLVVRGHR